MITRVFHLVVGGLGERWGVRMERFLSIGHINPSTP